MGPKVNLKKGFVENENKTTWSLIMSRACWSIVVRPVLEFAKKLEEGG